MTGSLEVELDAGLDLGRRRVGADDLGPAACAEDQLKGIHQDRLPGSRLAGDDVEARVELDFERFDDGEAPNAKARQHGRGRSTGVAWALHKR